MRVGLNPSSSSRDCRSSIVRFGSNASRMLTKVGHEKRPRSSSIIVRGIGRFLFFHACQSNSSSSRGIHHLHVKPLYSPFLKNSLVISVTPNLVRLVSPILRQE